MMVGRTVFGRPFGIVEGQPMNLFTVTIGMAGLCLLIGVIAVVRGRPLAGFLAIVLAVVIAGFGYREDILQEEDDPTPVVTAQPTLPATPVP